MAADTFHTNTAGLHSPAGQKDLLNPSDIEAPEFAGFWLRFLATILDALIVYAIAFVIVLPVYMINQGAIATIAYLLYPVFFLYYPIMESSKHQGTFGKKILGLIVTNETYEPVSFITALGRNLGKIVSMIILYVGYIMAAFTEKKQALHDIMAHTLVIKK